MKILHFGDYLPDERIERAAIMSTRFGYSCYYLGLGIKSLALEQSVFIDNIDINIRSRHKVGLGHSKILPMLKKAIDQIDPDIIHTHDIFNAYMIYQLYPERLVYDDHEYWSKQVNYINIDKWFNFFPNLKSWILIFLMKQRVPNWEEKLRKEVVIIASSAKIRDFHAQNGSKKVFYLPNMPLLSEVRDIEFFDPPAEKLVSSFVGRDISKKSHRPYRDTSGLITIFNDSRLGQLLVVGDDNLQSNNKIISTGFIPHLECYKQLSRAHTGLLGFKPHNALSYKSPQKVHMYVHAGCIPFVTPESLNLLSYIKEIAICYDSFSDLKDKLLKNKKYLINHSPEEIRKFARKNVILDNFQENLRKAYEEILSN